MKRKPLYSRQSLVKETSLSRVVDGLSLMEGPLAPTRFILAGVPSVPDSTVLQIALPVLCMTFDPHKARVYKVCAGAAQCSN